MSQKERNKSFVDFICKQCSSDKGIAAHFRRADTTSCDPDVLSTLVRFGLDITKDSEFIPYNLVVASIARGKIYETGENSFVQLLSQVEKTNSEKGERDDSRLRRLLACENLKDLALIFRQVMSLIQSRSSSPINYSELLDDLCSFTYEEGRARVKRKWAVQFYKNVKKEDQKES